MLMEEVNIETICGLREHELIKLIFKIYTESK